MNETGNLPGAFWEMFPVAVETHMRFNETVQPRNGCETIVVHAGLIKGPGEQPIATVSVSLASVSETST